MPCQYDHREDICYSEFIRSKTFALILNFTEVIMSARKQSFLKMLLSVKFAKFTFYKPEERPITALQTPECDRSLAKFSFINQKNDQSQPSNTRV